MSVRGYGRSGAYFWHGQCVYVRESNATGGFVVIRYTPCLDGEGCCSGKGEAGRLVFVALPEGHLYGCGIAGAGWPECAS